MSVAAHLAEPSLFTYKGREYKVHPWTFEVQAQFERHLERCAVEAYQRSAPLLSEADAERALGQVMRDVAAGAYSFGGPAAGKALDSPAHVRHIFWLCLKKHDARGEVTKDLVQEMARDDYGGVVRAMNMANTDPNLRAPAQGASQAPRPTDGAAQGAA